MLTLIIIVLLFASLVILHEFGHFLAARRNGVGVEEFGIGFPPKVYGRVRNGVEYTFNLLPLGGFVRMKGEDSADQSPGSFGAASLSSKTKILLAGVGMNLLTAFALFYALCVTGLPGLGSQLEPGFLKPQSTDPKQLIVGQVDAGSPAAQAGIKRGDFLLKLNGADVATDDQLRTFTKANAGQKVSITLRHDKTTRTVTPTLRPASAGSGFLGVGAQAVYKLHYDPLTAIVAAAYITCALLVATLVGVFNLIVGLPGLLLGLFQAGVPKAAADSAGPIGIVVILTNISALGWAYVLLFMANISVALAAFNALPLPALDGGRLFVAVTQKITGKPWKAETEAKYHGIGFLALIALMVLISVYDVRKLFP